MDGRATDLITAAAQQEFWYLPFHRLSLVDELIDGRPEAVRSYQRYFLDALVRAWLRRYRRPH